MVEEHELRHGLYIKDEYLFIHCSNKLIFSVLSLSEGNCTWFDIILYFESVFKFQFFLPAVKKDIDKYLQILKRKSYKIIINFLLSQFTR